MPFSAGRGIGPSRLCANQGVVTLAEVITPRQSHQAGKVTLLKISIVPDREATFVRDRKCCQSVD